MFLQGLALAGATTAFGQNVILTGALTYSPPLAAPAVAVVPVAAAPTPAPVVYQTPVAYQSPVIYPQPVAYAQPIVYSSPVIVAPPPCVSPTVSYCAPSSSVVYFGGPNSHYRNACAGNYAGQYYGGVAGCSTVTYFGRGEACERGYRFTHYR